MVGVLEKKYICLFCGYSSKNKMFICPECDRNKFASQTDGNFTCLECNYSSSELFRKCPICEAKTKPKQKRKAQIFSYVPKEKKPSQISQPQKEFVMPKEQNQESSSNELSWFSFLDNNEVGYESGDSTRKTAMGLSVLILTPIFITIAYSVDSYIFTREYRFYLIFWVSVIVAAYAREAIFGYLNLAHLRTRIKAEVLYWVCWLIILAGAYILHILN